MEGKTGITGQIAAEKMGQKHEMQVKSVQLKCDDVEAARTTFSVPQ